MPERLNLSDILDMSSYRRLSRGLTGEYNIKVPAEIQRGTFKFKRKGKGEYIIPSSSPIDFSSIDKSMLEELWSRLSRSDYDFDSIASICPTDLEFEIRRTYYALKFWSFTPGPKRYSVDEIFRSTLLIGPSYAERLSDEWDYGIRRYFRVPGISNEFNEWDPITHYNELPPITYLIRWQEIVNDLEYMKIPLEDFDQSLLCELREEIQDALPDTLELPTDVEVLSQVKTSSTLDLDTMKSIPFYQARLSQKGREFSHIFKGKRTFIPIGPTNTRDAVVTTIDTYNSVKWCDLIMTRILDEEPESLVNNNPQIFLRRLKNMTKIPRKGQMYWLRDIKKCGLTFPRQLFHLLQECLVEKYPDKDFSRFDIFRYYSIWDVDNKPVETVRGYCLGMANNLVTFIQCMLSKMLLKRIGPQIEIEALYGNDDSCLKIWTEDGLVDNIDAMLIQSEDYYILNRLNIITNDTKSFWSWYPILFEEYGHQDFRTKHSRIACALSSAMLAPDIKYAKLLTSSISLALWDNGDWIIEPLREIISKWGYEYYPQEVNYDYLLGGWVSIRNCGVNPLLRMIEDCPDELIQPIWIAMNHMNKFQKEVIRPVLQGTVTKNYSVTGQILNITYVDIEIYDVPELPVEMIYLDEKGYRKFYESIYRFNRNPYREMSSRLTRISSFHIGKAVDKMTLIEYGIRNFNKLAIPKSFVQSETALFEIQRETNLDCSSLMRNSLSRYLELLKENHLLMFPGGDVPASGEYPYVVTYDATPFTERINGVTTLDGNIPEGIYQFSTNPWLPLWEYVTEYDMLPTSLYRLADDKKHLPIWFMNKTFRTSQEVSIAYWNIDMGELFVDDLLQIIREEQSAKTEEEKTEKAFSPQICCFCQEGMTPWEDDIDSFSMFDPECTLCILGDHLWRARRLSQSADSLKVRQKMSADVPMLKSRMRHLVNTYFPVLISSIPRLCQESIDSVDAFYAAISDDEEGVFLDMFG
jgi:hypothetical protein